MSLMKNMDMESQKKRRSMKMETLNIFKAEYPFYKYVCGVTGLTCCGCSLFCGNREEKKNNEESKNE